MQYTIVSLALAASLVSGQTTTSSSSSILSSTSSSVATSSTQGPIGAVIPVGQQCVPGGTPCALGSQCYATNFMLQTICGNFQAACTSNQQCAFNTCNNGLCNGFIPSSSSSSTSSVSSTSGSSSSVSSTSSTAVAPITTSRPIGTGSLTTIYPTGVIPNYNTTTVNPGNNGGSTGGASPAGPTAAAPEQYTGAASVAGMSSGALVVILGALAFAL